MKSNLYVSTDITYFAHAVLMVPGLWARSVFMYRDDNQNKKALLIAESTIGRVPFFNKPRQSQNYPIWSHYTEGEIALMCCTLAALVNQKPLWKCRKCLPAGNILAGQARPTVHFTQPSLIFMKKRELPLKPEDTQTTAYYIDYRGQLQRDVKFAGLIMISHK